MCVFWNDTRSISNDDDVCLVYVCCYCCCYYCFCCCWCCLYPDWVCAAINRKAKALFGPVIPLCVLVFRFCWIYTYMYVYVEHLTLGCSLLYLNSFVCQQTTQFTSEFAKHQITEHRFIGLTFYDQIFGWLLLFCFLKYFFLASSVPNDG